MKPPTSTKPPPVQMRLALETEGPSSSRSPRFCGSPRSQRKQHNSSKYFHPLEDIKRLKSQKKQKRLRAQQTLHEAKQLSEALNGEENGDVHGQSLPLNTVEQEYDPLEPNNYELYQEQQLQREVEERERREFEYQLQEQERGRKELEEKRKREALSYLSAPTDTLNATLTQGGRGRGLLIPAWMRNQKKSKQL